MTTIEALELAIAALNQTPNFDTGITGIVKPGKARRD
jgi:hypothetical protein